MKPTQYNSVPVFGTRRNRYDNHVLRWLRLFVALIGIMIYFVSAQATVHSLMTMVVIMIYSIVLMTCTKFRNLLTKVPFLCAILDQSIIFYACYYYGGLDCPFISLFYLPVLVYAINTNYVQLLFIMSISLAWLILLGVGTGSSWLSILYPCTTVIIIGFFIKILVDQDFLTLMRHAMRDGLTGLYNYRYFYQQLNLMIEDRNTELISLLMIDLNEFKRLNDELGHVEGDRILQEVAQIIKNTVRSSDIVARYGGDEFAIILPGMGQELCEIKVQQLKIAITSMSYFSDVAVGASQYPEEARTANKLVELADKRMYQQKFAQKENPYETSLFQ